MKKFDKDFLRLQEVSQEKWQELSKKKVFFGHKSIGDNIIDGLNDIMEYIPNIKLNIKRTADPADFDQPIFAHFSIEKNKDPELKFKNFYQKIEGGIGDKADIVFLKLCYVDITADTNIENVFTMYKNTLNGLQEKYKNTLFLHVTVPLMAYQTGLKAFVKKIIGRPITGFLDNIKRNQFNEMLRKEYAGNAKIFDLARIESTYPDGKRNQKYKKGKVFFSMIQDYTNDGGHLNEVGSILVAEKLLIFLVNL